MHAGGLLGSLAQMGLTRPTHSRPPRSRTWGLCAGIALFATGCVLFEAHRQQQQIEQMVRLSGSVRTQEPDTHPLVVVLVRFDGKEATIFDHFVVEGAGRWYFLVTPGSYALGAFQDVNEDLIYHDEPALSATKGPRYELRPGERVTDIELVIPEEGRAQTEGPVDIAELQARTIPDQQRASMGLLEVTGQVVDLDDPRFDPKNAKLGLWKPLDFVFDVGPGIYFLEEYDQSKTPVLFVHGIDGSPRNFEALVKGVDRDRIQPWFYFYPSGAYLGNVSDHLSGLVSRLRVRYRFNELFVVAHSMGGLVARSFILKHYQLIQDGSVTRFISISTPWGGHAAAAAGVKRSPVVVYSWRDVAPGSAFLDSIFFEDQETARIRRRLPEQVSYHLLFGYRRNRVLPGASGDGVISESSMLRLLAQEEAETVRGFDYNHTEILRSPEVSALVNEILTTTGP